MSVTDKYAEESANQRKARDELIEMIEKVSLPEAVESASSIFGMGAVTMQLFSELSARQEGSDDPEDKESLEVGYSLLADTLENVLMILQALRTKTKERLSTFSSAEKGE